MLFSGSHAAEIEQEYYRYMFSPKCTAHVEGRIMLEGQSLIISNIKPSIAFYENIVSNEQRSLTILAKSEEHDLVMKSKEEVMNMALRKLYPLAQILKRQSKPCEKIKQS